MVFFSHCICIVAFYCFLGRWDSDTNFIPPLLVEEIQTLSLCRVSVCTVTPICATRVYELSVQIRCD